MDDILNYVGGVSTGLRIVLIFGLAAIAIFLVRFLRSLSQWLLRIRLGSSGLDTEVIARKYPKIDTVTTVLVSALTFVIYFLAVGLVLREFNISLTAYLASASVIGLAIGFGSQGFVQDVVIGLTMIFTDVLDNGDVVEISGNVGRVEQIGLRFTRLINLFGQQVFIPNRSINVISRFRNGCIRAYVDIQLPENVDETVLAPRIEAIGLEMYRQHNAIILTPPEIFETPKTPPAQWQYVRIKFRLWPGQGSLIETVFRQRLLKLMKTYDAGYADWMIVVTYRVEQKRTKPSINKPPTNQKPT